MVVTIAVVGASFRYPTKSQRKARKVLGAADFLGRLV